MKVERRPAEADPRFPSGPWKGFYKGVNEGRGIWGVWSIAQYMHGGFHIWPEGMADPTKEEACEEAVAAEPMPAKSRVLAGSR